MTRRLIFVLEDNDDFRESLRQQLERRDFQVVVAAAVEEARDVIQRYGHAIDVGVLDMRLEDSRYPKVTGADIGLELRRKQAPLLPELMIYSAYPSVDYYRQTLNLGTSIFLDRSCHDIQDVIRHVRALVLRHALSVQVPAVLDTVKRLASASRDRMDWMSRFCLQLLFPELERTLGAPFTLLLTNHALKKGKSTHPIAGTIALPKGPQPIYEGLQNAIFKPDHSDDVFKVDPASLSKDLNAAGVADSEQIVERLRDVRFISLVETKDARLSLGIAQEEIRTNRLAEDAKALARVMAKFLRNSVLDQLITLTEKWSASQFENRGMLRATSQFCLNIGQEQIAILDEAVRKGELPDDERPPYFKKLRALGESLRDNGELMEQALDGAEPVRREIDAVPLIQQVWRRLSRQYLGAPAEDLPIQESFIAHTDRDDLYSVVLQVLRWLLQRTFDRPDDNRPIVRVELEETAEGSMMIFEDFSRRIDSTLRERLFDPFAFGDETGMESKGSRFGLFVARALVVDRNGGRFEDLTDEMEGELGHRLAITFPAARGAESRA